MRVWVARLPKDTVRFAVPARARRCSGGLGGVLLQGARGGNGVAVWLRTRDSLPSGPWPLLQRGDTVTRRGAIVGVRYTVGEYAHGAPLDSGAVRVTLVGGAITLLARGGGLDGAAHGRLSVEATFDRVPLEADTVSCRSAL